METIFSLKQEIPELRNLGKGDLEENHVVVLALMKKFQLKMRFVG